jgi:hypothetical protein
MAGKSKSRFAGAGSAQIPGERSYFNAGVYEVTLIGAEYRDGYTGPCVVARFKINAVITDYPADAEYQASNRAGETVAVVYPLKPGPNRDFHLGRLKGLATACLGDLGEDVEAALEGFAPEEGPSPAIGTQLIASGTRSRTKDKAPIVGVAFWLP